MSDVLLVVWRPHAALFEERRRVNRKGLAYDSGWCDILSTTNQRGDLWLSYFLVFMPLRKMKIANSLDSHNFSNLMEFLLKVCEFTSRYGMVRKKITLFDFAFDLDTNAYVAGIANKEFYRDEDVRRFFEKAKECGWKIERL